MAGSATIQAVEVMFVAEKETPGTIRFAEEHPEAEEPVIGTLYVRKAALKKLLGDARDLKVTIEAR